MEVKALFLNVPQTFPLEHLGNVGKIVCDTYCDNMDGTNREGR